MYMDFKFPLALVGVIAALTLSTYGISSYITNMDYQRAIDNGYSCYYNGEEIDLDNISLSQYNYKVNDAENKITLTDKRNKVFVYLPFVYK